MEKHHRFFTSDHIDEQIEQPIDSWQVTPETRLLSEMQHVARQIRAEDGYSLQRVETRLKQYSMTRAAVRQEEQRRLVSPQKRQQGSFNHMKKKPSSPLSRRVSLLVAMLVMVLLVGSLVVVLNFVHTSPTAGSPPPMSRSSHEGEVISTLRLTDNNIFSVAWSPDSQRVATGTWDSAQIWDATTGKHLLTIPSNVIVSALSWSPDGRFLAIGERNVRIIDPDTGKLVREFPPSIISFARPSPGPYLSAMTSFSGGGTPITSLAWSPDGSLLAIAIGSNVVVWNTNTGAVVYIFLSQFVEVINSVSWSSDGKYIASTSFHGKVQVWNAHTGQVIFSHPLSDNLDPYASVAWAHHGMTLAFISNAHTTEVWNVATNTRVTSYTTPQSGRFAWAPDDSEIASINGKNVDIWDVHAGALVYRFTRQGNAPRVLAWSPNGKYIVSSDTTPHSTEAKIWVA